MLHGPIYVGRLCVDFECELCRGRRHVDCTGHALIAVTRDADFNVRGVLNAAMNQRPFSALPTERNKDQIGCLV